MLPRVCGQRVWPRETLPALLQSLTSKKKTSGASKEPGKALIDLAGQRCQERSRSNVEGEEVRQSAWEVVHGVAPGRTLDSEPGSAPGCTLSGTTSSIYPWGC